MQRGYSPVPQRGAAAASLREPMGSHVHCQHLGRESAFNTDADRLETIPLEGNYIASYK